MTARIIDGKAIAAAQRQQIAVEVEALVQQGHRPGLAAVLVGDDPASRIYVDMKERDCEQVGMANHGARLPATVDEQTLHEEIDRLNADPAVSGIIVQMPLPEHLDPIAAQERISPDKDVDGLGPTAMGRLMRGDPVFVPATPLGCAVLLEESGIRVRGRHVVIVGRSQLVGRPLANLLTIKGRDATVTICHSRTTDLRSYTRQADIIVMAIGRPRTLTADMVRAGTAVIDVGISRTDEGLVGDVDFGPVAEVAEAITPVPGGVGPMTRAMLLRNTLIAAWRQAGVP